MVDVEEIVGELSAYARDPQKAICAAKQSGKQVVGCVPYFVPMELVHAAGMHPVELWGGGVPTGAASSYYPAFYCSILFTLMEHALDGTYDDLDAVIIPTTCDGLRNLEENWKFARPDMTVIDYVQPAVRTTPEAHGYNVWQLKRIAKKLEEVSGSSVSERSLRESIVAYNKQREALRTFSALAADHTDVITPLVRQAVFAAARSMDVAEHTILVDKLNAALSARPTYDFPGKKVVLTGILVDSIPLLTELENNHLAVVGDWTVSESARYATDIPGRIDPFDSLATLWEQVRGASIALDPQKERGDLIANLVHERGADGVIACIVKFCEAEEFDVPVLKQQMERANIPLLILEVELQDTPSEQAATRIQAFAEMLDLR